MGKILKKFFCEKKSSFSDVERNFFVVLLKFSVGLSKLNPTHPKDILSGSSWFLKKLYFFSIFLDIKWKIWGFLSKNIPAGTSKLHFCLHRNTYKKWNFLKEKLFRIFLGHPAVNFWPFVKKISAELSKLHSMCQWKNLEDVCVLKKKFFPFWTFTDKYQAFCRIVFRLDRQNCFLRVQRRVLRKNNFLKSTVFHPFRTVSGNVSAFFGKFQQGCQNNILRVHRNILMKMFF